MARGPGNLRLKERAPGDERADESELSAKRDDRRRLRPVPVHKSPRRLRSHLGDGRDGRKSRDDPVERVGLRRADEAALLRVAGPGLGAVATEDGVERIAGHDPVGRVFAAADANDPGRADGHPVLARGLDGRAVRRGDERPKPGVRADDIGPREVHVHRGIDRIEEFVHLPARGGRTGRRSLERGVGRADEPVIRPRDKEDDLARHPDREPGLVRDARPRDDQVRAATRQDAERPSAERMVRFGRPDARGVDDGLRRDLELRPGRTIGCSQCIDGADRVRADARGADPGDCHAAGGHRGPSHGQGVAGVVLDAVVVQQAAAQAALSQCRCEIQRLRSRQAAMPAAVVARAQDVVERQAGVVERLGQERDPVDREEERLDPDEVRRQRQETGTLRESLPDEPEPELLEIAQPAVDEP